MLIHALHRLPPETAHGLALRALRRGLTPTVVPPSSARLRTSFCGFELPHPLGLAAGFDKNAEAMAGLFRLGFSFLEVGTVTLRPQAGNPRPRLFRLRAQQALINRMGFNNDGLEAIRARLLVRDPTWGPLGGNIGVNRDATDLVADYVACLRGLYELVDYIAINVSSPNTPGLRDLHGRTQLDELLRALIEARATLAGGDPAKPLFVKIAPDLTPQDEAALSAVALARGADGLIISNTTIERPQVVTGRRRMEGGGLSGAPLFLKSTDQLGRFYRLTSGKLPLIGLGGILSGADAYAKIRAGASALQLYTGLIYRGPRAVAHILNELDRLLEQDGCCNLREARGADVTT